MNKYECILLIDDDPVNNFITKRLLEKSGIAREIQAISNGMAGIQFIKEYTQKNGRYPELILLDINMPVMDGADFMRNIKEFSPQFQEQTQVVVLTTSSDPRDVENMTNLGVKNFIAKPLTNEKLLNLLNAVN